jgi:hypothetical protein
MKTLTIQGTQYNLIDINTLTKRALVKLNNTNLLGVAYAVIIGTTIKDGLTLDCARDIYYNKC